MSISEAGLQDLNWWSHNSDNIKNWLHPPPISKQIKTDASGFAWGGVFDNQFIGGSWSSEEMTLSINAKAQKKCLQYYTP